MGKTILLPETQLKKPAPTKRSMIIRFNLLPKETVRWFLPGESWFGRWQDSHCNSHGDRSAGKEAHGHCCLRQAITRSISRRCLEAKIRAARRAAFLGHTSYLRLNAKPQHKHRQSRGRDNALRHAEGAGSLSGFSYVGERC